MKSGKYEYLRNSYPEVVHLEQLYQILRVSKRAAKYLVENNVIPCADTGRKTWRYEISLDDIIVYLRRREQHGSGIPIGAISSSSRKRPSLYSLEAVFPFYDEVRFREYIEFLLKNAPDVMLLRDAEGLTGIASYKLKYLITKGVLLCFMHKRRHMLPKASLLSLLCDRRFLDDHLNHPAINNTLVRYEEWFRKQYILNLME